MAIFVTGFYFSYSDAIVCPVLREDPTMYPRLALPQLPECRD